MVKNGTFPTIAAGLLLAGCVNFSGLDNLKDAAPSGSPFAQALFKNYAFLARSFGDVGQASYTAFDQQGSFSLAKTDADVAALANSFASKAVLLSRGESVDPEPSKELAAHNLRDRLVRALQIGRDSFPRDAARAQADYDCWQLDAAVTTQAVAALQCRRSLEVTLPRLESEVRPLAAAAAQAAATKAAGTQDAAPDDTTAQ